MNYSIFYPTPLNEISDITNDNIDVLVNVGGQEFTVVVATPDNLKWLMKKEDLPFLTPATPFALVEKLSEQNIERLIQVLVNEPMLLKLYGSDLQDMLNR